MNPSLCACDCVSVFHPHMLFDDDVELSFVLLSFRFYVENIDGDSRNHLCHEALYCHDINSNPGPRDLGPVVPS